MNWKSELDKWFNEHHNEGIELLCELVEKNTTNPPGNEYLVAEVVKKFLSKYNINSVKHEAKPGRTNLLARIGTGSPVVFVPVHTDVVPAGDGWDTDPFKAVIKDGFIFGRGVADDKGPLVSAVLLAAFFKKHENDFNGTYLLGAVADEELGSTLGVSFLLENKFVDADYAIVPDTGAGILKVSAGEKSLLQVEVVFFGRQAHGSTPDKGLNAIWAANEFLNMISDNFDDKAGFLKEHKHDLFSPSTLNIGKIEAGNAFNIVPRECKVYIDIRYTPERTREELLSIMKDIADNIKDKGLCDNYIINEKCHMEPFVIENNHPLIKAISSAVAELTDKTLQPFGMGGTTVCKQLVESGIPAVGFSQDGADQAHRTNERLKISEIGLFGKALGLSFLKIIDYHS